MARVTQEQMMERVEKLQNAIRQRSLESFRIALEEVDTRDLLAVRLAIEKRYSPRGRKGKAFGEAISEESRRRRAT